MDTNTTLAPTPAPTNPGTAVDITPTKVPWLAVAVYAVLACGLAWVAQIPIWLSPQKINDPNFMLMTGVMMFAPTVAALVVTFAIVRPKHKARYLGLTPFRPKRTLLMFLVAPLAALAISFGAFGLAVLLGWTSADPTMAFWATMIPQGVQATPQQWAISAVLFLPLTIVQASIAAFGEELGWRGFLASALAPLGFWKTALFTGVLWGIWHAPIILLGYNFYRPNAIGLLMMIGFSVVAAVLQTWARYYARNVWLPTWTHGTINAVAIVSLMFMVSDADPATATVLGYPGWIVGGVVIAVMAALGAFGRRLPRPLIEAPRPKPANTLDPGATQA